VLASLSACTHESSPPVHAGTSPARAGVASPAVTVNGCSLIGGRSGVSLDASQFAARHPTVRALRVVIDSDAAGSRLVRLNSGTGFFFDPALREGQGLVMRVEAVDGDSKSLALGETRLRSTATYPNGPRCLGYQAVHVVVSADGSIH
jgi:hypothetical protein